MDVEGALATMLFKVVVISTKVVLRVLTERVQNFFKDLFFPPTSKKSVQLLSNFFDSFYKFFNGFYHSRWSLVVHNDRAQYMRLEFWAVALAVWQRQRC